ncbi:DNA-binding protein [Ferrimonas pelagia]|uniref:DNA-binding protein n=1 Tax=Ferrimonas pelagia TaxID=1177826 RepID=A0ABP9F3B6_9GAMM
MATPLSIQLDTPFLTVEEYAKRVGLSIRAVQGQIYRGQLPIKSKTKPNERTFINMLALFDEAASQIGYSVKVA